MVKRVIRFQEPGPVTASVHTAPGEPGPAVGSGSGSDDLPAATSRPLHTRTQSTSMVDPAAGPWPAITERFRMIASWSRVIPLVAATCG